MSTNPNHTLYPHQEKHRLPKDGWLLKEEKKREGHTTLVYSSSRTFHLRCCTERRQRLRDCVLGTIASAGDESPC